MAFNSIRMLILAVSTVRLTQLTGLKVTGPEGAITPKKLSAMPSKGFGAMTQHDVLVDSLKTYFKHGGRLVDTAFEYDTHDLVAEAIKQSGVPRDDVWITTKLCGGQIGKLLPDPTNPYPCGANGRDLYASKKLLKDMSREEIEEGTLNLVKISLKELGTEYVDLMLLHKQTAENGVDDAIWSGLTKAKDAGLISHLGVCNPDVKFIDHLSQVGAPPEVVQMAIEPAMEPLVYPYVKQLLDRGMRVTAYGSLGGGGHPKFGDKEKPVPGPISAVAAKYNATFGQVMLRFDLDLGVDVIPQSSHHIVENLDIDFFKLTKEDISVIAKAFKDDPHYASPQSWYHPG